METQPPHLDYRHDPPQARHSGKYFAIHLFITLMPFMASLVVSPHGRAVMLAMAIVHGLGCGVSLILVRRTPYKLWNGILLLLYGSAVAWILILHLADQWRRLFG